MASYCTTADLYDYGLPRGGTPNPGRLVGGVSVADNSITLDVHGFSGGDPVSFRAEAGGSLPAPLAQGVTYYALPTSESSFKVEASIGGGVVALTSEGARIVAIAPLPIDAAIRWASRVVDDMIPGHAVELTAPYPELIVATTAELAATKLLAKSGSASKTLGEHLSYAHKRLERWSKGIPVRGLNVQQASNLAQSEAPTTASAWSTYGGI